jgi:HPr kinase/phosphorylase
VSDTANIDLIISLETREDGAPFDRLGSDTQYTEMLDVRIPYMVMPVRPGRNLAAIVEVAAMNNKLKHMGINSAAELEARVDGREVNHG